MHTDLLNRALLYSIWAGLFLLLFMPLIVSTETIFPFIVGKAIYSRVIIALVFGLWAALAFRNASFRPARSRLILIFGIYLFISLLAGIFGVSFQRSLWSTFERMQGIVDLAHWVGLLVVMSSVIRNNKDWIYLLNANMAISLLVALVGLGQSFGADNIPFYPFLETDTRVGATLGNPAFVGTFLMLNVIVASGLLLRSFWTDKVVPPISRVRRGRSRRRQQEGTTDIKALLWRGYWLVVILVNLWVMTLTGTRGAVIGLIVGIGFFSVAYVIVGNQIILKRSLMALMAGIILLGVLVLALRDTPIIKSVASNNVLVQRMTDLRPDQAPFTSRLFALTVGYKALSERPILGWGPENYIVPYGRYYVEGTNSLEVLDQAHNKPIEELVTKGILGLVSYMAIWFFMLRIVFQRVRHLGQRDQIFILTTTSALAAYFIQNLFLFDTPVSSLQFAIFAAIIVGVDANCVTLFSGGQGTGDSRSAAEGRGEAGYGAFGGVERLVVAIKGKPILALGVSIGGLVVAFAIVVLSLWLNIRAYSAGGTILEVGRGVASIDVVLDTVNRSIDTFSPLANYPRLIYIRNVGSIWSGLDGPDAQRVLELAEKEGSRAIAAEPENWRIYVSLADMYREISGQSPGFEGIDSARHYLNVAEELAPEREEVLRIKRQLDALELKRDTPSKQ